MTTIKFKNGNNWENMALSCYPVGSVYMSINSTSPSNIFGGTWAALEDRMLIGASSTYSVNSTGGAATVTLTSAQSGVPAHSHGLNEHTHTFSGSASHSHTPNGDYLFVRTPDDNNGIARKDVGSGSAVTNVLTCGSALSRTSSTNSVQVTISGTSGAATGNTANNTAANASQAHENMPPYLAVYMWKRTA